MDIGSININITAATNCRDDLKDKFLKELLSNYCNSLDLILTTLSVPISFMAHGLRKSKAFHFSLQDANTMVMNGEGIKENDPKKTAEELIKYFEDLLKNADKNQIENAVIEIEKLIESYRSDLNIIYCTKNIEVDLYSFFYIGCNFYM